MTAGKPVAIIPARGGSKRIPRKNVKLFHGRPIVEYAVRAALRSGVFSEVLVSTDDPRIAAIARKAGAAVPFLRSKKNASDRASISEAVIEAIEGLRAGGRRFDYFACVMATAAFVTPERLRQADALMRRERADSVVAVTRFEFPIQRAMRITGGKIAHFTPRHFHSRSQDLEPAFHDCGQFFFCKTGVFLRDRRAFSDKTYALEVPASQTQDIDTPEDWKIAELKFRLMRR
jgi:N-acylneuraminate cytidylyltransferase